MIKKAGPYCSPHHHKIIKQFKQVKSVAMVQSQDQAGDVGGFFCSLFLWKLLQYA